MDNKLNIDLGSVLKGLGFDEIGKAIAKKATGEALGYIKDKTGIDLTPDNINTKNTIKSLARLDKELALEKERNRHKEEMEQMKNEKEMEQLKQQANREETAFHETQGARDMFIAMNKSPEVTSLARNMPVIISLMVFVFSALIIYAGMFTETTMNKEVVYFLMGNAFTLLIYVIKFWIGSSIGSKVKDETIYNIASRSNNPDIY
jgi:hypothetical protein